MMAMIVFTTNTAKGQSSESTLFGLYSKAQEDQPPAKRQCYAVASSKSAENFMKAYLAGNKTEAVRNWKLTLDQMRDAPQIYDLGIALYGRIILDAPDDANIKSKYSRHSFFTFLLDTTDQVLGKNHRFDINTCELIAIVYEGEKNYKQSEMYRSRAYALARKYYGEQNKDTLAVKLNLVRDKIKLKQYDAVEPWLKEIIDQSDRANYEKLAKDAVIVYARFLTATHRRAEAETFVTDFNKRRTMKPKTK